MDKCPNCSGERIDGQAIHDGSYIWTCLSCGWWEREPGPSHTDWITVGLIAVLIVGGLALYLGA